MWKKLLGSVTDSVDQELRLRNAYLAAENRILRDKLPKRLTVTARERHRLVRLGTRLGSAIRDLVESGVETLTIAFINSYISARHEEEVAAIVERLYPGFPVTVSSHVLPEFREY